MRSPRALLQISTSPLTWAAIALLFLALQGLYSEAATIHTSASNSIRECNEVEPFLEQGIQKDATLWANLSSEPPSRSPAMSGAFIPPELPGWPCSTAGDVLATPRIGDIDNDGDMEVLVGDSQGYVYAWNYDGSSIPGWPIYVQTMVTSPVTLGDLDNDGDLEIVLPTANGNRVYAWHHNGTPVTGWPVIAGSGGGSASCAATIEDLDDDGYRDVIVGSISCHVYAWDRFGMNLPGWPQPTEDLVWCRAPAVADLDYDGDLEVVVGDMSARVYVWHHDGSTAAGWPILTGGGSGGVRPAPVVADIDGDSDLEIFACSWADRRVNAWHHDGAPVFGWPVMVPGSYGMVSTPAIGDLDGSPGLEIMAATYSGSYVQALHTDGTVLPGWPIYMSGQTINSSFAMADIDGDGDQEVLIGSQDNCLYAWHHDGSLVDDFPLLTGGSIVSSPTVADVDLDGDIELAIGSYDHLVHIWDLEHAYTELHIEWATQFHDNQHTNLYVPPEPSDIAFDQERAALGENDIALRLTPNPFCGGTTLHYSVVAADPAAATANRLRAAVYDADGRLVRVLSGEIYSNSGNSLFWDGRDHAGRRVPSAIYYVMLQASGTNGCELGSGLRKVVRFR
ncbi:MAG: VCBS repeat-containing protein [Candidatus Eisenbacteria sp.]|nr:VCBS repeat-containing protein [Candidatus Eisenbacteria bacterium]